jgi:hypothetical protein
MASMHMDQTHRQLAQCFQLLGQRVSRNQAQLLFGKVDVALGIDGEEGVAEVRHVLGQALRVGHPRRDDAGGQSRGAHSDV